MSQVPSIDISSTLRKIFPDIWLRKQSRKTGAVQRQRNVKITDLFWGLILGFRSGNQRSLAGLRRSFQKHAGITIEESSYQKRFTPQMALLMRNCCRRALSKLPGMTSELQGRLAQFQDLFVTDSSVIRLHELLADEYPGTRTNQAKAAMKAHLVFSVTGKGKNSLRVTSERHPDGKALKIGTWVRNSLLLFDLGYYHFQQFANIDAHNGYFVSRLKNNANPSVLYSNLSYRGRAKQLTGLPLQQALEQVKRDVVDVMAEFAIGKHSKLFRVLALRNPYNGIFHTYVTNLPPEQFSAEDVATLYGFRWQIELLFRELKQYYRMEQIPSSKKPVAQILLYAAIITCVVSWRLLHSLRLRLKHAAARIRLERWAAIFADNADTLLMILAAPKNTATFLQDRLVLLMEHEAPCPNHSRLSLLQRTEQEWVPWLM